MRKGDERIWVTLTPKQKLILNILKNFYGTATNNETVRMMLSLQYEQVLKMNIRKNSPDDTTPQTLIPDIKDKSQICQILEGRIEDENCVFVKYDKVNPHSVLKFEVSKPISHLNMIDIQNQFIGGTKKEIMDTLAEQELLKE